MRPELFPKAAARRSRAGDAQSGQAMLEFFFAALIAMVMILGILQIGLLFNAYSMVKLAAFNAARAAVVARGAKPQDPVTLSEMRSSARLAAFLTLVPVIPGGLVPRNVKDFASFASTSGVQKLGVSALEFLCCGVPLFGAPDNAGRTRFIDVKFVKANSQNPVSDPEISTPSPVEFDDKSRAATACAGGEKPPCDPNLIKVVVTWQYPLVIPIANRIIIAAVRPTVYLVALLAAGTNPLVAAQVVAFRNDVERTPVWALGTSLDRFFALDNILRASWRVPVRATYVMRMQWDRKQS